MSRLAKRLLTDLGDARRAPLVVPDARSRGALVIITLRAYTGTLTAPWIFPDPSPEPDCCRT